MEQGYANRWLDFQSYALFSAIKRLFYLYVTRYGMAGNCLRCVMAECRYLDGNYTALLRAFTRKYCGICYPLGKALVYETRGSM